MNYTYDALGNPILRSRAGAASQQETGFTATYDTANRMLTYNGSPLTYDAHGNLTQRQTPQGPVAYTWDARNQLTQISGPHGTAAFKYDHAGRRIEKTINGVTTAYLYDGNQAVAELQGSSVGTTYLTGLQIDEVLAIYSNQGNRTALTDALGSVLALTDDTQAAKTSYSYSPFGETTQAGEGGNALQYTGRENDGTGLYYYRARYYMPDLKRFASPDPIGLEGGINEAAYALNNPLRYIDPTGLWGVGVSAGGTVEAGAGTGFGAQASSGVGIFGGGSSGITTGGFTNSGAFAGTARPDQFVDGATAGLGGGLFITNAKCAKELLGPFDTWTLNLPIVSLQYATDGNIWTGSFSVGRSFGFSFSRYKVTTTTASGCECK